MYSKTHWQDRVVEPETGEVVQEGTFMSAEHFNNMEDGIEANDTAISEISESIETIETTLDTGVGTTITLTVNSSTFVMKLALKNSEGNILSESEVDLPIESMIVNAEYVEATKSLVLTLQSGSKVTVPFSALINGLVNDSRKVNNITLESDVVLDGDDIKATGYAKAKSKSNITGTDTINQALGKLELKADTNETNISTLKKHMVGELTDSDFTEDTTAVSVKTVPSGMSNYAAISKIGGKTVKDEENQVLKNAVVESVVSVGKNLADFVNRGYTEYNGIKYIETGNKITASGTSTGNGDISLTLKEPFDVSNGEKISISLKGFTTNAAYVTVHLYDSISKTYPMSSNLNVANNMKATITSSGNYNITIIMIRVPNGYNISASNGEIMAERASSPTEFSSAFKTTLLIPEVIKNLPDYGCAVSDTIYNWVDFENSVYHHVCTKKCLGDFTYVSNGGRWETPGSNFSNVKINLPNAGGISFICSKLEPNIDVIRSASTAPDLTGAFYYLDNRFLCIIKSATTASEAQEFLRNVDIVYELAQEETIPLSDYLRPLPVENGGTITLQNEHNLDMPNTILYKKEVSLS